MPVEERTKRTFCHNAENIEVWRTKVLDNICTQTFCENFIGSASFSELISHDIVIWTRLGGTHVRCLSGRVNKPNFAHADSSDAIPWKSITGAVGDIDSNSSLQALVKLKGSSVEFAANRALVEIFDHLSRGDAVLFRNAGNEELCMYLGAFSLSKTHKLMHDDIKLDSWHINLAHQRIRWHTRLNKRIVQTEVLCIFWLVEILMHLPHLSYAIMELLQTPQMNHAMLEVNHTDADARLVGFLQCNIISFACKAIEYHIVGRA
ncbi:hypothetical protein HG530_013433 [Fusarium avenaceum]|nr:hypothetical protein HG530_013433 [Fusarium avenaceum]